MTLRENIYALSGPLLQSFHLRLLYYLKQRPRVSGARGLKSSKAPIVFWADFELAWAWRYSKSGKSRHDYAVERARRARRNFPLLLELFDRYNIPVTWAVVGHLFLEGCARKSGVPHTELPRPDYFENEFWSFQEGDWYDHDPCVDRFDDAPEWYAPDCIRSILASKTRHEIGSHTFSHLDLSHPACSHETALAELLRCQGVAADWNLKLKSLVFPGNLAGNFAAVREAGFESYRVWTGFDLDWPRIDEQGLYQLPSGICTEKPSRYLTDAAWLKILHAHVDSSIETGAFCSFWFHPSMDPSNLATVLPGLLQYVDEKRERASVTTASQAVAEILGPNSPASLPNAPA